MEIRPLESADVPAAAAVANDALPFAPDADPADRDAWMRARVAHLLATDPGGAWVADEDGTVTGLAMALVRDGVWGLSLLAVRPHRHGHGAGRRLLEAALRHGAREARGGIIVSSTDPRAMRLYARAGFDLRPCVELAGIVDRSAIPGGLRSRVSGDLEHAGALARAVRGGGYAAADLATLLERPGAQLLLFDGRGFAIHRDGNVSVLAAADDEAAADLLWSALAASPPGSTVSVDYLTARQDWAVRTGLDARLVLSPGGPVYTRGELGPLAPWMPSGAFL